MARFSSSAPSKDRPRCALPGCKWSQTLRSWAPRRRTSPGRLPENRAGFPHPRQSAPLAPETSASWALGRARASGLRQFERVCATLARDHRGPQQELARAFLVGADLPQLVEIFLADLRVARFEPFFVGDRVLLHELDGNRAPLQVIEVEQAIRRA